MGTLKKFLVAVVLVVMLACSEGGVVDIEAPSGRYLPPPDTACTECTTCDPKDMPSYTMNYARFEQMAEALRAKRDSANIAADSVTARIMFFGVCKTGDGLAMVGIIRFEDGHMFGITDYTVVDPIDSLVTGVK